MGLLAVELNDAGIRAARAGDAGVLAVDGPHPASPGFAHVEPGAIVTGVAAHARCCLHPLAIRSRFWEQLDVEPIDPKDPRSPNRAEVACAHLRQVLDTVRTPDDEVVFAVSPVLGTAQLGILVGIARELDVPLRGLVASPVALPAAADTPSFLVVDLGLHRCVLSIVETGARMTLGRTEVCPDVGLEAFRRQWIRAIGNEFVRTTRFDPRHDAATEQRLHDGLPDLLDTLVGVGSVTLPIGAGALVHRVTVTAQLVAQAGHDLAFSLAGSIQSLLTQHPAAEVRLSYDATRVPGLERLLRQQCVVPVHGLPAGAAALGLVAAWPEGFPEPEGVGVAYHTWRHAPAATTPDPTDAAPRVEPVTPPAAGRPTHVLLGGRAHPLPAGPLVIGHDAERGTLTLGPDGADAAGVACLRPDATDAVAAFVLEVRDGHAVRVNGAAAAGAVPVTTGAEITVSGCDESLTLITLAT